MSDDDEVTEPETPRSRRDRRRRERWTGLGTALALVAMVGFGIALWHVADHGGCDEETPAVFSHFYHVTDGTMSPQILPGEWIWVRRRYYCTSAPQRGNLAVLAPTRADEHYWLGRIVGLPGDRVQIQNGRLAINGTPVEQEWLQSEIHDRPSGAPRHVSLFTESLPRGPRYRIEIDDPHGAMENTAEITVPADHYYVLGDGRDQSYDSRAPAVGPVPRALIVDRPVWILWGETWNRVIRRIQ
ncbi:MAG TPA: signal peptidase I [Stellaceae bacterium]|nr:signal peptidase I [Stellaceae bacterium]